MITKKYTSKNCKWCNKTYTPRYPHQLYCSSSCSNHAKTKYNNERQIRYRKKYKNCKWCNKKYIPMYPHQLYCSSTCSSYARIENDTNRKRCFRKKYNNIQTIGQQKNIGTGNLGCHPNPDFTVEHKKIQFEFYFLKLK